MKNKRKQGAKAVPASGRPASTKRARSAGADVPPTKQPRSLGIDHSNARDRRPVWRFEYLDLAGPPSGRTPQAADYQELHAKLAEFEKLTCKEIWDQGQRGKAYDTDSAHPNITARLTELDRDDETRVHNLRLRGAYRVYGILRENVFHVLWLDTQHEMWPSKPKNT